MMKLESEITFHLGGNQHAVNSSDVTPETTLNSYLRDKLQLTATKKMCLEGGCGSCIVAVEALEADGTKKVFAVNSCLVSIFSCHGWKILTNEGIGDPLIGYHAIQKLLADNNGTQCGFCSSGMVMNMYALHESGPKTELEIEDSFGGNLCRCTGYRPILTAFKKLASDSDDIEDVGLCSKAKCESKCRQTCEKIPVYFDLEPTKWMKVYKLVDLLEILRTTGNRRYMLVAGNTARGVYLLTPSTTPELYIDVTAVKELTTYTALDSSLVLGGNMSLNDTMSLFRKIARKNSKFTYLDKMADHLDLVAHVPVRNIGTLAGNLMIKHHHNEFPSDVFLILETVAATLVIVDVDQNETRVSPQEFLEVDMNKKVLKQILLPAYGPEYFYGSYKIMPRAQNAHAMVNAGFLLNIDNLGQVKSARIVYGGINPTFVHAFNTEALLLKNPLFNNNVLQQIFQSLDQELKPDWVLPDPSPSFRKQLAINLFYKYVLSIAPPQKISERNKSGATLLSRPVSSGTQQIYSKEELYPLTQPILKVEALAQTSGQAQYILDMPDLPHQLHCVFVKAQAIPGSTITNINPIKALNYPDVVAFYSAKDIPGMNNIAVAKLDMEVEEKLFCDNVVQHYSQPVGIIVANNLEAAEAAAKLVKISTRPPTKKPLFTIQDVLAANETSRITHQTSFKPKSKGTDIKTVINGKTSVRGQYHFHMETQMCVVIPTEDGLDIFASTQWMQGIQGAVSQILNIPSQKISMFVRRLGGAFGAKQSKSCFPAGAAALAAFKLNRPVKMWMNFHDNMDIIGKRYPLYNEYEVGVNASGVIQYLTSNLYSDYGIGGNEPMYPLLVNQFQNCYVVDTWTFDTYTVVTDNAAQCYTRAPGTVEGITAIETIMDHIANTIKLDPVDVRRANMDGPSNPLLVDFLDDLMKSDDIVKRKADIEQYNKVNKWKKKGISVIPMKYVMGVGSNFTTVVSIYNIDGGVAVSHGGIEMGQGINTKVVQVCAYKFGIPMEKVSVKSTYNVTSPNSFPSGGSLTSETVVYSLLRACDVLLERIKPIREKNPKATWEELIQLCYEKNVCLSANGFYSGDSPGVASYTIFGVMALEVEVDILTGKHEILRLDILEDVGQSMSPLIDIGQLEGAVLMGIGYHTMEELIYSAEGQLLTNRTWNYKVPGAKDIPQDFRVRFSNKSLNPLGVLNSKAIAEPPTCLTIALPLALRAAVASARREASPEHASWYPIDGPSTVENTLLSSLINYKQFTL
ncbi:unnamed protein product [Ceutorhynchus assimilis]|uniref:Indole-3-acetaldehyde oxidase n=1 Tax=Ceutorhynchus assimilis TaxID=467358 RepID=A0A9N9MBZ5_9CUCU|nr:unnamed protein product [Ceutorhynchus assimilis]